MFGLPEAPADSIDAVCRLEKKKDEASVEFSTELVGLSNADRFRYEALVRRSRLISCVTVALMLSVAAIGAFIIVVQRNEWRRMRQRDVRYTAADETEHIAKLRDLLNETLRESIQKLVGDMHAVIHETRTTLTDDIGTSFRTIQATFGGKVDDSICDLAGQRVDDLIINSQSRLSEAFGRSFDELAVSVNDTRDMVNASLDQWSEAHEALFEREISQSCNETIDFVHQTLHESQVRTSRNIDLATNQTLETVKAKISAQDKQLEVELAKSIQEVKSNWQGAVFTFDVETLLKDLPRLKENAFSGVQYKLVDGVPLMAKIHVDLQENTLVTMHIGCTTDRSALVRWP